MVFASFCLMGLLMIVFDKKLFKPHLFCFCYGHIGHIFYHNATALQLLSSRNHKRLSPRRSTSIGFVAAKKSLTGFVTSCRMPPPAPPLASWISHSS